MTALRTKWRLGISYAKLALHPFGLASLAGLIAVILIEFLWPTTRHFFGGYPVTLGIIVGLLNLIVTLSVAPGLALVSSRARGGDGRPLRDLGGRGRPVTAALTAGTATP